MSTSRPKVSIIFANFNGGQEPIDCLNSILKLDYPASRLEVIVVDNGSSDGSPARIRRKFPKFKLIELKTNTGFAKAINLGIRQSLGDYVFIANDDLVFEENSLKEMVNYATQQPKVGVIGGRIYLKAAPKKLISTGFNINRWTGDIARNPKEVALSLPDWVQGCALLTPKSLIKKIGGLDEGFEHLFEDVDFCFRARKAGFNVVYLPQAIFWHGESLTADKNKPKKYYQWYKSKIRFVIKHFSALNLVSILLIQTLLVMPYRTIVLRDGRGLAYFRGLGWNIINMKLTLMARGIKKSLL